MKEYYKVCKYSPYTGVSVVVKQNKYGEFRGIAQCKPDDEEIANQWDGCKFAEYKCDVLIQQEKAKRMRERARGAVTLVQNLAMTPSISHEGYKKMVDHASHMLDIADEEYQKYIDLRDNYQTFVDKTLKERREVRERIQKHLNGGEA